MSNCCPECDQEGCDRALAAETFGNGQVEALQTKIARLKHALAAERMYPSRTMQTAELDSLRRGAEHLREQLRRDRDFHALEVCNHEVTKGKLKWNRKRVRKLTVQVAVLSVQVAVLSAMLEGTDGDD